ncbi:MAG: hypothetical protein HYV65_00750 [Candidatus Spechtbacteria bacterium]|nr:hypothetical protein [Candidatus Spechtbacteria bacterium]
MKGLSKDQIAKIVSLRESGHSLPEIRRITSHSNGTVFKYIQGVSIKSEFFEYWENRRKSSVFRQLKAIQKADDDVKNILGEISQKEKILVAAALYWAEGAKRDSSLINSDPELLKVFIECLYELGIMRNNLSMSLRIYEDINQEEAIKFWTNVTRLSKSQITSVDVLKGKKTGKLKYGMCRVRIIKGNHILKLFNSLRHALVERITNV